MATQGVSGLAVAAAGGGLLFLWSGAKGVSVSQSLRSLLSGHQPTGVTTNPIGGGQWTNADQSQAAQQFLGSGAQGGTPARNEAIARLLAAPYGWSTGAQWDALDQLWQRESSWSQTATNPDSGAYGIPQALPPTKLPAAGQKSGGSSASAQISWGLEYIKQTYGSPVNAWAHEQSAGWY